MYYKNTLCMMELFFEIFESSFFCSNFGHSSDLNIFFVKTFNKNLKMNLTRPNCALDRRTVLCLYVPGFHRQVFKHGKILSERSKKMKEQKKNKGSVLVAESAYNAPNAQFGLVMNFSRKKISDQ